MHVTGFYLITSRLAEGKLLSREKLPEQQRGSAKGFRISFI